MVAGLKFLSKKSFNPQNLSNQKAVYERQQEARLQEKAAKDRDDELRRERDEEELAKHRGETLRLGFVYAAPPGLQPQQEAVVAENLEEQTTTDSKPAATNNFMERQPGDDDAAAAFRALLASASSANSDTNSEQNRNSTDDNVEIAAPIETIRSSFGAILHGSSDEPSAQEQATNYKNAQKNLSALERAVGKKKHAGGTAVTLDEQCQRFPALAHAPRARGLSSSNVGVSFKPLGSQIRNVKCLACGTWGHSLGDRECKKSGWNPFEAAAASQSARPAVGSLASTPMEQDRKQSSKSKRKHHAHQSELDDENSASSRSARRSKHRTSSSKRRRTDDDRRSKKKRRDRDGRK
jgi:CBF1 interacting corepressor